MRSSAAFILTECPIRQKRYGAQRRWFGPGGSVIFQEWDYRSMRGPDANLPLYSSFIERAMSALSCNGVRMDMGLRLVDALVEAGLPVPAIRTELQPIGRDGASSYRLLQTLLNADPAADLAAPLKAEALAAHVHAYFPLQVGVWARKPRVDALD